MIDPLAKKGDHGVSNLCRAFGVSRSGYYPHRDGGVKRPKKTALESAVKEVYHTHKGRYGSPKVWKAIARSGVKCNEKTVAKIMRENGLRAATVSYAYLPDDTLAQFTDA